MTTVVNPGGGLSIGDTIGNSPTSNGLLYSDGGALANDLITIQEDSFFGGAVTAKSFDATSYSNFPTLGWVDATGFGQPGAVGVLTPGVDAQFYFMIDTSTLSAKAAINYDPGTPANSYFAVAMANGLGGTPELYLTTSAADLYVPLDMNSNPITAVDDPTNAQDVATKNYVDGLTYITADDILPTQTGNSGEFLTTNGTTASWAAVSASPGGSNTQVQFNNSGAFGGSASLVWDGTRIKSNSGFRMNAGSGNTIGDVDGNGNMYFDGNSAHIYGYAYINLRDGTGQYANLSRGGAFWEGTAIDTGPFGGGNYDAKMVFSGGQVNTYDTKAFGNYFGGKVGAQANGDKLYGVVFRPQFNVGSYTGLTKIGTIFVTPDASSLGMVVKGTSSQSVDMLQIRNSSDTVLMGVTKNGGIKLASMADGDAENSTLYYSTTASKAVYKDSGGTVNNLY